MHLLQSNCEMSHFVKCLKLFISIPSYITTRQIAMAINVKILFSFKTVAPARTSTATTYKSLPSYSIILHRFTEIYPFICINHTDGQQSAAIGGDWKEVGVVLYLEGLL